MFKKIKKFNPSTKVNKFKDPKTELKIFTIQKIETRPNSEPILSKSIIQNKKFICSICFKELKSSSSLGKHIRNKHGEKWQCNYCHKKIYG